MIIYSRSNLKIVEADVMKLQLDNKDSEGQEYLYVSSEVFQQASVLTDIHGNNFVSLLKVLKPHSEEYLDCVTYLYERLPEPLKILSPFLCFVDKADNLTEDMEYLCGVLHMMSLSVNFKSVSRVKLDVRSSIKITMQEIARYNNAWRQLSQIYLEEAPEVQEEEQLFEENSIEETYTNEEITEENIIKDPYNLFLLIEKAKSMGLNVNFSIFDGSSVGSMPLGGFEQILPVPTPEEPISEEEFDLSDLSSVFDSIGKEYNESIEELNETEASEVFEDDSKEAEKEFTEEEVSSLVEEEKELTPEEEKLKAISALVSSFGGK